VKLGVVASLNQPGGNMTGVTQFYGALGGKRLELIREPVPQASIIAVLTNPKNPNSEDHLADVRVAANAMGQRILVFPVSAESEIAPAFAGLVSQGSKRPEGRRLFPCRCDSDFQSESTHLQFAQQLHPQGRCRLGDGAHLREFDGARRGRARRAVRPCCARGANIVRWTDLSFPDAAWHHVSRWQSAHRRRRRLFAESPQGQGPPDCPAIAARRRRRGGGRRRDRGGAFRGPAGARRAAVRGVATDFFAFLLLEASVRRDDARGAARQRSLQGRAFRARPQYRVRASERLVGCRPAGRTRAEQFRYPALRILP